ncbi:hypothetical protein [Caldisericum sp.]|uniref:hypothetical protein n=1 Tax=Caldisericum sp. TaxID=2499687 RepID=UPI003D14A468
MGMTVGIYLSDEEVERLSKQVGSTQAKDISKFLKKLLLGKLKLQELNLAKLNQDILQELRSQCKILLDILQILEDAKLVLLQEEMRELTENLKEIEELKEKLEELSKSIQGKEQIKIIKALLELGRNLIVLKERRAEFEKTLLELLENND